jgi:hypothetical protein
VPGPVIIPTRFCGPPDTGNGGITAGLLAAHIDGAAEITLRRPSPLATPMQVRSSGGGVVLRDGDDVVAEGTATTLDVDAPAAVSVAAATDAAAASPVIVHPDWHPFPTCFVCGPDRAVGDGLRVLPGRVGSRPLFAAPVRFPPDLAAGAGDVPAELLWAALDCPSSFVMYMDGTRPTTTYVLGRIAARIDRQPAIDATLVALSWPLGFEGRKLFAASALYQGDELVAVARATWISV